MKAIFSGLKPTPSPLATPPSAGTSDSTLPRWAALLVWGGLAVWLTVLFLRPLAGDIWFHLLAGRYALDHGAVPHHEFFLYEVVGLPQTFTGWGFGLLAELAIRAAGAPGLSIFNGLLWSMALCLGLWAAARACDAAQGRKGALDPARLAGFALALLVVMQGFISRSVIRPEVTLYLSWLGIAVLFEAYGGDRRVWRALLGLPLASWALAWLHTTSPILMALWAGYALLRWNERGARPLSLREMACWIASALGTLLLPLFNPNGLDQILLQVQVSTGIGAEALPDVTAVGEYLPLWHANSRPFWPAAAVLAAGTVVWFVTAGRRRWSELVLIAPMVVMTLAHRRGIGLWAMALFVPLARALSLALGHRLAHAVNGLYAVALAAVAAMSGAMLSSGLWSLGGLADRYASSLMLHTLEQQLPAGGNVWAMDVLGPELSYILGERIKVPYSGHMSHPHAAVLRHYDQVLNASAGWEQALQTYDVRVVGVTSQLLFPTARLVPLAHALARHPQWQLVGIDRQLMVFVKRPAGLSSAPVEQRAQIDLYTRYALQMARLAAGRGDRPDVQDVIERLQREAAAP